MKIEQNISSAAAEAVKALYGVEPKEDMIQLQKTKREFEGSMTLVVFPLLRVSKKKPEDTATEIGEYLLKNCNAVDKYNVVKGFLNLCVSADSWTDLLNTIDSDENYGIHKPDADAPLWMIEYSSPNTNKPLHLGHVRNNLLGWAVANI